MCGFIVCLNTVPDKESLDIGEVKQGLYSISHRGPDDSNVVKSFAGSYFGHTRLSIVSPKKGSQPIMHSNKTWVHNGEIYNHKELKSLSESIPHVESDSAAIGIAYEIYGDSFVSHLDGVFSLAMEVVDDEGLSRILVARDPLGVKPLFYGHDFKGDLCFASEMKALSKICKDISIFPPGTIYSTDKGFQKYYRPSFKEEHANFESDEVTVLKSIKNGLENSVKKRLMGDVSIGALLSGGLDSSLVAAIAARELKKEGKTLTTFSVGLESSTMDLEKAKLVAKHIGSNHHSITYSVQEGIESLREMISLLESYDITTVRASTPMYIMSKYIKKMGIKSVLSGEGADEMFGGYLYFAHAPSSKDFQDECIRRIEGLHQADLLRADRSTMGASVEARVPFLDLEFLEKVMAIDPEFKVINKDRAEKWILRSAFKDSNILPCEVLWRQKEQFSDGVGYEWVDGLKELAEAEVSDKDFKRASEVFPFNTPATKEAFLYRRIFSELYSHPDIEKQTSKWVPRWQDYNIDPSGRANKVHEQTTEVQKKGTPSKKSSTYQRESTLLAGK